MIGSPVVQFAGMWAFWAVAIALTTFVIHVMFALGVWRDASDREQQRVTRYAARSGTGNDAAVAFAPAFVWALATLLGGVFVAGIYWLIHYSTLRPGISSEKPHEYVEPLA